jgi:carbonic anhydrase/acetyltransferase-like protein (isoleucine patch superfamily)
MIEQYLEFSPQIDPSAWVHSSAYVSGEVVLCERVSIWPTSVLRGDQGKIFIGQDSNIQDGSVVHSTGGLSEAYIGARVTVGHRAVIHGCHVEDDCLIGMGSIVMDNARIGSGSIVGAGAVVTAGTIIPPGSLVLGSPGRVVKPVSEAHGQWILHSWQTYVRLAKEHRATQEGA